MTFRKTFLPLALLLLCTAAGAQLPQPVKVETELKTVSDTEADIVFRATIQRGWHMYSTQEVPDGPVAASFHADQIEGAELGGKLRAVGREIKKYEEMFGTEVHYFEQKAEFVQRIRLKGGAWRVAGYLQYGACDDQNCLPPTNVEVSYKGVCRAQSAEANAGSVCEKADGIASTAMSQTVSESADVLEIPDGIAETDTTGGTNADETALQSSALWTPVVAQLRALDSKGEANAASSPLWQIFLLGMVGGLVALLTPCVWPIIPMTVSFFLHRAGASKRRGVRDACIYGASIVVIYVALGLLVTALFGASALNSLATNAVFNIFFFLLLVVFAASFLGAFELTLPSSWSSAVDSKAERTGGLLGIFLMAFTLTLVSFSCTGPIIGFLLVEVGTSGQLLGPTLGMLGFALALALPFTLFALFPTWLKSLPRSGGWMNTVKVTLGFVELAFALKFLSVADLAYGWGLLDRETFLALWIALFGLLGLYLLGKLKFPHDGDTAHVSVPRFFLGWCAIAFAIYMIPGLWGAPLKAVSAFAPPMKTQDFNLYAQREVRPQSLDYEEGMRMARAQGKPVLIDFTGYGCVNCRKMEASVWTDDRVAALLAQDFVLIQLYVDEKTPLPSPVTVSDNGQRRRLRTVGDKWSFLQSHKFGANAQPFYVLLDNEGRPLTRAYGFDENAAHFRAFLRDGLAQYKERKAASSPNADE